MFSASGAEMTASTGTSAKSAIFSRISRESGRLERHTMTSGEIPMRRSSWTECCVGLVLSSPATSMYGTSVQWMYMTLSRPTWFRNWRSASRNGQALDVSDGAADLGDHDVDVGRVGGQRDPALDLVGDVRDHLHGRAQVLALALAADDLVVDRPGRVVRVPRQELVDEALVVAEVEVGLGAVLGHVDLAVLERAHRAGVDVDVGVELLERDPEAPRLEQPPERRRGDPLAQRRHNAPGHEHVLDLPAHARPFPSGDRLRDMHHTRRGRRAPI